MKRMSALLLLTIIIASCGAAAKEQTMKVEKADLESIKMTIVYDNRVYQEGLQSDHGFSCVVEVEDTTILFDTGASGLVLMDNIMKLGIDPHDIDIVVISHDHWDHVGGLGHFIEKNHEVVIYDVKPSFLTFDSRLEGYDVKLLEVPSPTRICRCVYSTGTMGTAIAEQALLIPTDKGTIVITGCAHPGIVNIVKKAAELTGQEILLVMGGFHLLGHTEEQVKRIVSQFKELGVQYAGPCHCTGERAIELFAEEYGDRFVKMGTGRIITSRDLIGSH